MSTDIHVRPTVAAERIQSMDIIRGISLCGILLMNIVGFGLFKAYDDPTNSGGATGWNLDVWWINSMFFEGTMRGMFSMLFGAGILIFTGRAVENQQGTLVTDLFFRRLIWLLVFGIIHSYLLLWDGEILYCYALVGMFAFSFRHLSPKHLIIGAACMLAFANLWDLKDYISEKNKYAAAQTALQAKANGVTLTQEQAKDTATWDEIVTEKKATQEALQEEMKERSKGYWSIVMHKAHLNQIMQTFVMYRYFFLDALAMMLLGMAFFKLGIIKALRTNRFYLILLAAGYSIGLAVNDYEAHLIMSNNFSILAFDQSYITYNLGRVAMTCGHIGLIMLFIKSGWLMFLQRAFAAVGQMAFTNYITQTLICNFIFLGCGLSMYGKLQRYELYYIVVGIWIFQLIVSPIWLRYFRFGPLEWVWRSLTYWERQPFRKRVVVEVE